MKCSKCGATISPASSGITYRSKSYHQECFLKVKEEAKNKNKKKVAVINDSDLQQLTDYVCELFSLPELTPLLRKQLEDYHTKERMSWKDIYLTALYWFELDEGFEEVPEQITLGIIPFVRDEALAFFENLESAKKHNDSFVSKNESVTYRYESKSSPVPSSCNMEDL